MSEAISPRDNLPILEIKKLGFLGVTIIILLAMWDHTMSFLWSVSTIFNIIDFDNFYLVKTTLIGPCKLYGI